MSQKVYDDLELHGESALDALQRHITTVRTGRASLALVDGIRVEYYGQMAPLNQVATLSLPDPRTISIQPWDKNMVAVIEKAIQQSQLGLTPNVQGGAVRIHLPDLSEERRKDLVKVVKKMEEDCKVGIRHARQEANKVLEKQKKDGDMPEDDFHKAMKHTQDLTDKLIKRAESMVQAKEKEILEF